MEHTYSPWKPRTIDPYEAILRKIVDEGYIPSLDERRLFFLPELGDCVPIARVLLRRDKLPGIDINLNFGNCIPVPSYFFSPFYNLIKSQSL